MEWREGCCACANCCLLSVGGSSLEMRVDPSTAAVRPFVVCAILRDCSFTERAYHSFLDLQAATSPLAPSLPHLPPFTPPSRPPRHFFLTLPPSALPPLPVFHFPCQPSLPPLPSAPLTLLHPLPALSPLH